jgi:hypothetical protein
MDVSSRLWRRRVLEMPEKNYRMRSFAALAVLLLLAVAGYISSMYHILPRRIGWGDIDAYSRWRNGGVYICRAIAYDDASKAFIVSSPVSGRGDIWQIAQNGSHAYPLVESAISEIDPMLSNNRTLYFSRFINGRYCVCARRLGTDIDEVIISLNEHATGPCALPDGSGLLFVRQPVNAPANLAEIWIKRFETGIQRQLTNNGVHDGYITCFSDSRRVIFCRSASDVYIMDIDSGECKAICPGVCPAIGLNEECVFFMRRRRATYQWDLWRYEFEGGAESVYPSDGSYVSAVSVIPNGSVVVVFDVLYDNVGRLGLLDVESKVWQPLPRLIDLSSN